MYKKLFQLSNLSNGEICRRLDISHTYRIRYEKSKKIDLELFVFFGKKLNVTEAQMSKLVWDEIRELCK